MKVGDLVKWSFMEHSYHIAFGLNYDLTNHRRRGIIVDKNQVNYFVRWENGDLLAQKPNTIEVISD